MLNAEVNAELELIPAKFEPKFASSNFTSAFSIQNYLLAPVSARSFSTIFGSFPST